jgi:O-antigen ligase/polysaccharide polymerase Wzy-like membrane protein
MRRAVVIAATAAVLVSPTVLAFFSGGYFAEPRLIAAIVVWALVLALAVTGPAPLPRTLAGALAAGGLAALAVWSAVSIAWAPLGGPANESVQRLVLYLGALLLAIGALRDPRMQRAAEPVLAAGTVIVIGYGLAGRLLPGLIELSRSRSAGGRLEQPITYWNAEGALAAIGLVLCARIAGDRTRPAAVRAAAAAAVAPLGAGVYLSFSRGAIAAAAVGLVVLVAAAPTGRQLRAAGVAVATGVAAALAAAPFAGVASLAGAHRSRDGAVVLALLLVIAAVAALVTARAPDRDEPLRNPRWIRAAAAAAVAAVAIGLVAGGLGERPTAAELGAGASAQRLTTVSSNRYEYWRVGVAAFADHPLQGLGAGGFRVEWLKERPITEAARDTHSLEVEMAAELGLVGLLAFAAMIGGAAVAARRALQRRPALAAGGVAACVVWLVHASIDWDWQLPAVTLPAVALTGALIALAEDPAGAPRPAPAVRSPDPIRA